MNRVTNMRYGPRALPILGHIPQLLKDPLEFLRYSRTSYGDIFYIREGLRHILIISDAAAANEVLVKKAGSFKKGYAYQKLELFLGKGLFTADGEVWRNHRRLMQPAFHRSLVNSMADDIVHAAIPLKLVLEEAAAKNQPINVASEMLKVALKAVATVLLGSDLKNSELEVVEKQLPILLDSTLKRIYTIFEIPVPTPSRIRERAAKQALDDIVHRIIRDRRALGSIHGQEDLLSALLDVQGDQGHRGLSDIEVRDEVMTLFLAGHETTATLLTFLFLNLSRYPNIRQEVQAEVRSQLGDRLPTATDRQFFPLLNACIQETLRLYPPLWMVSREAIQDTTVAGLPIAVGDSVDINIFSLHHSTRYWTEPEIFNPKRWLGNEKTPEAFMPFGAGARMCIGNHLALLEASLIAALILQHFVLEVREDKPGYIGVVGGMTLKPASPILADVYSVST